MGAMLVKLCTIPLILSLCLGGLGNRWLAAEEFPSSAAGVEFFEKHVRAILVDHCYECHAGEESDGGLRLDSRASVLRGGDTGKAVVPGDTQASLLLEAVGYENLDLQMPPSGRLSDAQIASLEKWISMGAPDPRDEIVAGGENRSASGMSVEAGRDFWSFRTLSKPAVPEVESRHWVRNPIDAFVLAALEAGGLSPAPAADRRTLIRRLTYDLTGLPPTIDEIETFIRDESPTAYARLVERLLASEQYGVRWGRHWLDVARYADSNGLDENLAFGNAWRYRDYVINAFNRDMPFDRFVIEQLAGDLLSDADEATKTATGFLVLGAKVLAEPDREKLEMDTIDEQLDATGKAFLGMTIGCVRCHDHKFDPITQSDYYALAAIFKSTKTFGDTNTGAIKHWNEHVFATDDELSRIKKIDEQIAAKKKVATQFKNDAIARVREEARSLATEYLVAATQVDLDLTLREVDAIAEDYGLHPRILHHCRRHLHFHRDDPVFAPWHSLNGLDRGEAIADFYRPLFAKAMETPNSKGDEPKREESNRQERESQKVISVDDLGDVRPEDERVEDDGPGDGSSQALSGDSEFLAAVRAALLDPSGFLAVPAKPEFALDPATLAQYHQLMEVARLTESEAPDVHSAMGVCDGDVVTALPIHIRGSHRNLGEPVERNVPAVMRPSGNESNIEFVEDQSGRLQLARWMVEPNHPLTARVYVNRLWRWHFGQGIVSTTENFGVLGDRPSHPELLDWLARYLIESGWSTKQLHRLIVHSSTYQQQSTHPHSQLASQIDPGNELLWKFPLHRLEAEQIHDSILAVCGQLDQRLGGKTVPLRNRQFVFNHTSVDHTKYDMPRRAVYLPVIRNNLYTTFEQFDFPDPTMPTGNRGSTVVAPQALLLMNSPMVTTAADALARELLGQSASDRSRIESAFQSVLRRSPFQHETERAERLIEDLTRSNQLDAVAIWSMLCQGLIATNEFMYVR
jgi:hypothetical protein